MVGTRLFRSHTFRLSLIYLFLFSAAVLLLLGFVYWSTTAAVTRQIDTTIDAEITGLAEQFRQRGIVGLVQAIERRAERAEDARSLYLLTDRAYTPLAGNLSRWPGTPPNPAGWVTFPLETPGADVSRNFGRARLFDLGGRYHLLVGHDIRERVRLAELIRNSLVLGLALTIALAVIGALTMSRHLFGKVETINRTSREIIAGDLSRRVPVGQRNDEFDQLAQNLNAMLDQIERLLDGMRQVSDNIAHDLRIPLTRLRSRLELSLIDNSDQEATRQTIEQAIAETDGLIKTFNALLSIAQAEAGATRASFQPVDLSPLLTDVIELYEPLAEENDLTLTHDPRGQARVSGDRNLIFQAVANLVDNAMKFAPRGSEVRLGLELEKGWARLSVRDRGPGIPAAERDKVLGRFYRREASRSTPGSGLGLSLVAAVARLHGAHLTLGDNGPGLVAQLALPLDGRTSGGGD